jgi:hypothetical protein
MSTFAEATVTPLPSDGGGMPMEARRDNEESFGGDDVDGKGLSVSTMLTKAVPRIPEVSRTLGSSPVPHDRVAIFSSRNSQIPCRGNVSRSE